MALPIISSQGVAQWREDSLFILCASPTTSVFSDWEGEEHHYLLLGISQHFLPLLLALSLWKQVVIMPGSAEEEEGKQGVFTQNKEKNEKKLTRL